MDRDELDARRSDDRPETFKETVARLYNDADLHLETEALPDLHVSFNDPIVLSFDCMPGGAISAETIRARMSKARAKLLQVRSITYLSNSIAGLLLLLTFGEPR